MKKLFPLLLLFSLLLAGCAGFLQPVRIGSRPLPVPPAEEVAVEPERSAPAVCEPAPVVHEPAPAVFAPTPDLADTAVYLDGSVLPAFWQGQAIYVRLHDYVALTGGCRTDFADIQNKKECGGNRQWQNHYLRNWAANTKGKGII